MIPFSVSHASKTRNPNAPDPCLLEQNREASRDAIVRSVARTINTMDQSLEHGALIVNDNGNYVALRIVTGDSGMVSFSEFNASIVETNFNYSQVVALIHSHPKSTNPTRDLRSLDDRINLAPAPNDFRFVRNDADLTTFNLNTLAVDSGADGSVWRRNFSHFIIGPNDSLREFDSERMLQGIIVRHGAVFRKNNYYNQEGNISIISKLWASFTRNDATSQCS